MEFVMQEHGFSTETEFGSLQICGEEEYGYRPYQLLVSSIAVCSGGVLRKIMEKRRQTVHDIRIQAEVTRSGKGANEVQKIHLHFLVAADHINESKMEKNMEWTRKNCSMVQSVKDSIEVKETFEIKHQ
ncbi:OsmC family protein [Salibacterium aidingense]|uniref:OsmC family protein n=1 Tax=Salibacterium aidingense TaxID=384933 RepID=UPI000414AFBD|nr:OsmC family protein [Salibacterium aidingense]